MHSQRHPWSNLEAKPLHAALVSVYCRHAVFRGVGSIRKEHAFISLRLLILAHTAGLHSSTIVSVRSIDDEGSRAPAQTDLGLGSCLGAGRDDGSIH